MLIDIKEEEEIQEYTLDLSRAIELMRAIYKEISTQGIQTKDGKTLKISGVTRTALKALITPFVLPQIERMYAEHGLVLEKPIRHTDLIDYSVNSMLDFLLIAGDSTHAIFTSQTRENSRNSIISVVATWQEKRQPDSIETTPRTND